MHDHQIRSAFHKKILSPYHTCADARVVDEFGIKNGSFRADIAVLNGKMEGFEIKGTFDTLYRLPDQVEAYNSVFEKISLVACETHLTEALKIIPDWWGVYSTEEGKRGGIHFSCIRRAKKNENIDLYALVQLLWRDEAFALAENCLETKLPSKLTRYDLYSLLSLEVPKEQLLPKVLCTLKLREGWRTDHLQSL